MSSPVADIFIWIFLAAAVGFGLLGFVGLVIFPDIRSRMFTALRATMISVCLVTLSVVLFGINGFVTTGGELYAMLVIHTLFLFGILTVAMIFISRILLEQVPVPVCQPENTGTTALPEK